MRQREEVERLFSQSWEVQCPVCGETDAALSQVDLPVDGEGEVIAKRMACTNCGFVVRDDEPFLADVLLRKALGNDKVQILREYGIY